MAFTVRELPKARQDKHSIYRWLDERSPAGAVAWLEAYDSLLERLQQNAASFGLAAKSPDCDFEVRQGLFKTRRGRVYRVLFFIDGQDVYVSASEARGRRR